MNLEVNSDPPLSARRTSSRCCSARRRTSEDAELRALSPQAATQSEEQLLRAAFARAAAAPIVGPVGRAVEQTLGVDLVQIEPEPRHGRTIR